MRKICAVTGARAEYGHLRCLLDDIRRDRRLRLQIVAAAMHLRREFGMTCREIESDGFRISARVPMTSGGDTAGALAASAGRGIPGFSAAFEKLRPDLVLILGDRYEMLCAAFAALLHRIPIAHIHGGETSQGAVDEAFRHSITKMALLHFPSTEAHAKRVIQLGEDPARVFPFGAPGLDRIHRARFMDKTAFERSIGFRLGKVNAVLTYHPVTLEGDTAGRQTDAILDAVSRFDIKLVLTAANSDAHGRVINSKLRRFAARHPDRAVFVSSLGRERFLSCLENMDLMIGNSSSGLIEAPSFGLPVVNIGDRQKGRTRAASVIDCGYSGDAIARAVRKALSPSFRRKARTAANPYDRRRDGKISWRIKEVLRRSVLDGGALKKKFWDLPPRGH